MPLPRLEGATPLPQCSADAESVLCRMPRGGVLPVKLQGHALVLAPIGSAAHDPFPAPCQRFSPGQMELPGLPGAWASPVESRSHCGFLRKCFLRKVAAQSPFRIRPAPGKKDLSAHRVFPRALAQETDMTACLHMHQFELTLGWRPCLFPTPHRPAPAQTLPEIWLPRNPESWRGRCL